MTEKQLNWDASELPSKQEIPSTLEKIFQANIALQRTLEGHPVETPNQPTFYDDDRR